MARIAVVTSHPPFAEGGHVVIARSLRDALREAGHVADLVMTPQNRFGRQGAAYLATFLTDVGQTYDGHAVDQIITLRFPSYAVRHPKHVCWLNHRMREYYDLWDRFAGSLSAPGRLKESIRRRAIHSADHYLLTRNVTTLFAQSATVQARLRQWGSIESSVLRPPPPPRPYRCDGYGPYFFTASRLTPLKRLDLLVRALAEPEASLVRCVIAGDGEEAQALASLARSLGVSDRVDFLGRVDDRTLLRHLAACRAVCFTPHAEDYGFVTAEAFTSRKAVITCHDSGGPAELVQDEVNGLVCDPTPASVATALRRLMDDATAAERMGEAGHAVVRDWTWAATVERLIVV